jgi:two-component system cell cycle response regulator
LQQAAERLTRSLRPHDLLARYGGDELAVLLEDVSEGDAREVAERLRRAIAAQPFTAGDTPVTLTISIGIARFPEHGQTPDALLHAADTALYRAKAGGRNRVVMADIAEG